jgi:hypothetical protein
MKPVNFFNGVFDRGGVDVIHSPYHSAALSAFNQNDGLTTRRSHFAIERIGLAMRAFCFCHKYLRSNYRSWAEDTLGYFLAGFLGVVSGFLVGCYG